MTKQKKHVPKARVPILSCPKQLLLTERELILVEGEKNTTLPYGTKYLLTRCLGWVWRVQIPAEETWSPRAGDAVVGSWILAGYHRILWSPKLLLSTVVDVFSCEETKQRNGAQVEGPLEKRTTALVGKRMETPFQRPRSRGNNTVIFQNSLRGFG